MPNILTFKSKDGSREDSINQVALQAGRREHIQLREEFAQGLGYENFEEMNALHLEKSRAEHRANVARVLEA